MANICSTSANIYGDEKSIKKLVDAYKSARSKSKNLGVSIKSLCEEAKIPTEGKNCRSDIYDFEYDDNDYSSVEIFINSDWVPPYWLLAELNNTESFPDVHVSFIAEELGCDLYVSNDVDYYDEERFLLYSEKFGTERFCSREDMDRYLKENGLKEGEYWYYELAEVDINGN